MDPQVPCQFAHRKHARSGIGFGLSWHRRRPFLLWLLNVSSTNSTKKLTILFLRPLSAARTPREKRRILSPLLSQACPYIFNLQIPFPRHSAAPAVCAP